MLGEDWQEGDGVGEEERGVGGQADEGLRERVHGTASFSRCCAHTESNTTGAVYPEHSLCHVLRVVPRGPLCPFETRKWRRRAENSDWLLSQLWVPAWGSS